jgi:hypothetical protein
MFRFYVGVSFLLATSFLNHAARGDNQPQKKDEPEAIPAPKVVQPPATIIIEPYYPRTDTRDVWQHYGVNSFGRFVPRVINTPYGYLYSRDLEPYPWAGLRPRMFRP